MSEGALVVEEGTGPTDGVPAVRPPDHSPADLYRPFDESLSVTGGSISVIGAPGQHSTIFASDPTAKQVDALQYDLGEGPRYKALRTGQPVLIPNGSQDEHPEWPVFGAAVKGLGVGALFTFPLVLGAATIGVADLYRSTSGALSTSEVAEALVIAGSVAGSAVRWAMWSATKHSPDLAPAPELRREIHQATGMIIAQLDTSATEAFARLRGHAFATGRSVSEVAHDVVQRRLDFRDLND